MTHVACIDASGAVPLSAARIARQKFARLVRAAVDGPMDAATFNVRIVDSRAYEPSRDVLTVTIPAVPVPPTPPELPSSVYDADKRNELIREYNIGPAAAWQRTLATRRDDARKGASAIMAVKLTGWAGGRPNVMGCVYRAAATFPARGDRVLYVLSDLSVTPEQSSATLNLARVTVHADVYCALDVETCDRRKRTFRNLLLRKGRAHRVIINDAKL